MMMKKWIFLYRFAALTFVTLFAVHSYAIDANENLRYPELVKRITETHQQLWTDPATGTALRSGMYNLIEGSAYKGLDKQRYHYSILNNAKTTKEYKNPDEIAAVESYFTDALIAYSMDITGISAIDKWISYNGLEEQNPGADIERIVNRIGTIKDQSGLQTFAGSLEPATTEYNALLAELKKQQSLGNKANIQKLQVSLMFLRWIHQHGAEKYIVVNIPSAMLHYYENRTEALQMKVVVGKPSTKTPLFATYAHQVILYPYWHVPKSIAVNEILPDAKKNSGTISAMNLQVWTAKGKQVSPSSVNWRSYSKDNFPYTLRQESGCSNALGVVKFDLQNPFAVYLHDTNFKGAFQNKKRYLSHGCVRVEKPIELANRLLQGDVDASFLQSCERDQEPITKKIDRVPVFIVYMPAVVSGDSVSYMNDVYKKL